MHVYEYGASALAQTSMIPVFLSLRAKYCKVSSATKTSGKMGRADPAKRHEISASDTSYDSFGAGQKHFAPKEEAARLIHINTTGQHHIYD